MVRVNICNPQFQLWEDDAKELLIETVFDGFSELPHSHFGHLSRFCILFYSL